MKNILRKIIPIPIRKKLNEYINKYQLWKLKQRVIAFLEKDQENIRDSEKKDVLNFFRRNSFSVFPYEFNKKYHSKDIIVYTDDSCGLKYVIHDNKRLYFKREWNEDYIKYYYNGLLIEQDNDSPHRYEYSNFHVYEQDVVVDIGVAEGNFALSVVELAKKLFLFESDDSWLEALNMTFAPWQEKVIIVNKTLSNNNNDNCITLDNYFSYMYRDNNTINFLKVDIEGFELQLLEGAKTVLEMQDTIRIAICTYHRKNDGEKIESMLTNLGFKYEYSKGYMIYFTDPSGIPCWLSRGLIRGWKHNFKV
jgi:hypothetical protein